jgi:predicted nucleic acid-binding protein
MDTVYIETSIVSHATARPSSDSNLSVLQQQARDWWSLERPKFFLVTSQLVLDEAALGDSVAATERLKLLDGIPLIPADARVERIAEELIARSLMPAKARLDALHVAAAAVGGIQFLLTQNCRHIANAHTLPRVYRTLDELGFPNLLIYTPAEFLGSSDDDEV